RENVSRAPNLSTESGRDRSIQDALDRIDELELDPKVQRDVRRALNEVAIDHSKAVWAVSNASPEELAKVENKVKRISQRLVDKGVRFAEVREHSVHVKSAQQSAGHPRGRRTATRALGKAALKSVPVAGVVVTGVDAAERVGMAAEDDAEFSRMMREMGVEPGRFENLSVKREVTIIAAEETGSEGASILGGAAAGAGLGALGCTLPCAGVGAVVGAIAAGTAGGVAAGELAAQGFDESAQVTPEELIAIRQRIRQQVSHDERNRQIVEDSGTPSTF
ncbi:MAG: hypothetical protein R3286_01825, partial [Gammaproteobacteria bacterium]|nr:hypothetical protein [Gammaproteobacteria bacterium]